MRLIRRTMMALACMVLMAGLIFSSAVSASAAPHSPNAKIVDLTHARAAARANVRHFPITGVVPPAGREGAQANVAGACSEPACPVMYNGGQVQTHPRIYLLLWGPSWGTDPGHQAAALYMENFYSGLGGEPSDSWSTINDQYYGSTGSPSFTGSVYAGAWQDTSTPPYGVDWSGLAAEADGLANTLPITDQINSQIVVATQDGTCPSGFYATSCGGTGTYCAWHSESSEPFINMPYVTGTGSDCGENRINSGTAGTYDGFSIVGGHEYAETVSDPSPGSGWMDVNDPYGGENGDKCSWRTPEGDINLATGSFAMQSLWSNDLNGCVMSEPQTYSTLTVSKAGSGSGAVTSQPAAIACGPACSATLPSASTVTLTAAAASGSTFAGWSGACTGTSTACTLTMNTARAVTAVFNASSTRYQETAVQFEGWFLWSDSTANGGSWRTSTLTNDTASFAFSGTSVTWLSNKGPSRGIAAVTIDGVSKGTVDLYSATPGPFSKAFGGLTTGAHTIVIKVTGTKNAASSNTGVVVDGFTVGTTTTQENGKAIQYNAWKGGTSVNASGGAYRSSGSAGAVAQFKFSGTSVSWVTAIGPGWGKAEVFIDNVDKGTVDLYASTAHWQTPVSYTGLAAGTHTIQVKVLGTKNALATKTTVPIDGFDVP